MKREQMGEAYGKASPWKVIDGVWQRRGPGRSLAWINNPGNNPELFYWVLWTGHQGWGSSLEEAKKLADRYLLEFGQLSPNDFNWNEE